MLLSFFFLIQTQSVIIERMKSSGRGFWKPIRDEMRATTKYITVRNYLAPCFENIKMGQVSQF